MNWILLIHCFAKVLQLNKCNYDKSSPYFGNYEIFRTHTNSRMTSHQFISSLSATISDNPVIHTGQTPFIPKWNFQRLLCHQFISIYPDSEWYGGALVVVWLVYKSHTVNCVFVGGGRWTGLDAPQNRNLSRLAPTIKHYIHTVVRVLFLYTHTECSDRVVLQFLLENILFCKCTQLQKGWNRRAAP